MHCHLLIPALFPPPALTRENDPLHGACAPALQTMLSRGAHTQTAPTDMENWLCETFGVARGLDYPVGAFSAMADGIDVGNNFWLRADPVHLSVERDRLILTDASSFPLSQDEADALIVSLNRHFATDGLLFFAPSPKRWLLRLDCAPSLSTHGLYQAAGNNIHALLPAGPDAMRWRALLNEVQMLLFEHPVNIAREGRGVAPVNSVWPWGGGMQPQQRPLGPFIRVWSNEPLARGLALAAGIPAGILPECADASMTPLMQGNHLMVLDSLRPLACYGDAHAWREELVQLEQRWFAPLKRAIQSGRITLTLHIPGTSGTLSCSVNRSALWKLWHSARPLANFRLQ